MDDADTRRMARLVKQLLVRTMRGNPNRTSKATQSLLQNDVMDNSVHTWVVLACCAYRGVCVWLALRRTRLGGMLRVRRDMGLGR